MSLKTLITAVITLITVTVIKSQDIIYTISGGKITAKVLEINPKEIKYKSYSNIEGPNYVINNSDVVLIQFANGTSQIINQDAPALKPKKDEIPVASKTYTLNNRPTNIYYLHPNLISINALALMNGDFTLLYDREFCNSHLNITALGGYNFNQHINQGFNAIINSAGGNVKKNFDAGLGISFMPNNTRRGQYFIGLLGKYMNYNYQQYDYVNGQGGVLQNKIGTQLGIMFTNGWVVRVTENLNFKLFGSLGISSNHPFLNSSFSSNPNGLAQEAFPKMYFGYCFGYRF